MNKYLANSAKFFKSVPHSPKNMVKLASGFVLLATIFIFADAQGVFSNAAALPGVSVIASERGNSTDLLFQVSSANQINKMNIWLDDNLIHQCDGIDTASQNLTIEESAFSCTVTIDRTLLTPGTHRGQVVAKGPGGKGNGYFTVIGLGDSKIKNKPAKAVTYGDEQVTLAPAEQPGYGSTKLGRDDTIYEYPENTNSADGGGYLAPASVEGEVGRYDPETDLYYYVIDGVTVAMTSDGSEAVKFQDNGTLCYYKKATNGSYELLGCE